MAVQQKQGTSVGKALLLLLLGVFLVVAINLNPPCPACVLPPAQEEVKGIEMYLFS